MLLKFYILNLKGMKLKSIYPICQADIDTLVTSKREARYMMEGTYINVNESASNPFDLDVEGVESLLNLLI